MKHTAKCYNGYIQLQGAGKGGSVSKALQYKYIIYIFGGKGRLIKYDPERQIYSYTTRYIAYRFHQAL